MTILQCAGRSLDLAQPHIMGILNLTPDSFSDGGRYLRWQDALTHAQAMQQDGATIIDLGAESTRPGAHAVSSQEEMDRLLPVLEQLSARLDIVFSIDTSTAEVISASAQLGAGLINDVRALTRPNALQAAAATGLPVCLMHMQGQPNTMQEQPKYDDVVLQVLDFLQARMQACQQAGISAEKIVIDPGFGFGKTLNHNLQLLAQLQRFQQLACPVLVGVSRKSMLGAVLNGAAIDQRLYAGLAAAVLAVERGASIIRTHDVKPTYDALKMLSALLGEK